MSMEKIQHMKSLNRKYQKTFYDKNKIRLNAVSQKIRDDNLMQGASRPVIMTPSSSGMQPVIPPFIEPPLYDEDTIIQLITDFQPMNEATRSKKISSVKIIFNANPTTNLVNALNNFDFMKIRLENAHEIRNPNLKYSPETVKVIVQCILWIVVNLNLPIKKSIFKKYENLVMVLKQKSMEHKQLQKSDTDNDVLPYTSYLEKIRTAFGDDSVQYLIASIYTEITARDDFLEIVIFPSMNKAVDSDTKYLVLPSKNNGVILLNHYKTSSHYGMMTFPLTSTLTNLIRRFITKNDITTHLFPENIVNGLTKKVSDMNAKIGIKGGINIIRRMKISDFCSIPDLTIEDRVRFSTSCMHSTDMQDYYNFPQIMI